MGHSCDSVAWILQQSLGCAILLTKFADMFSTIILWCYRHHPLSAYSLLQLHSEQQCHYLVQIICSSLTDVLPFLKHLKQLYICVWPKASLLNTCCNILCISVAVLLVLRQFYTAILFSEMGEWKNVYIDQSC